MMTLHLCWTKHFSCSKENRHFLVMTVVSGAHLLAASRLGLGIARRLSPGAPLASGSALASDGGCPVSLLLLRAGMPSARAAPCPRLGLAAGLVTCLKLSETKVSALVCAQVVSPRHNQESAAFPSWPILLFWSLSCCLSYLQAPL